MEQLTDQVRICKIEFIQKEDSAMHDPLCVRFVLVDDSNRSALCLKLFEDGFRQQSFFFFFCIRGSRIACVSCTNDLAIHDILSAHLRYFIRCLIVSHLRADIIIFCFAKTCRVIPQRFTEQPCDRCDECVLSGGLRPLEQNRIAAENGSERAGNMVALGALVKIVPWLCSVDSFAFALDQAISARNKKFNEVNLKVIKAGYDLPLNAQ